MEILRKGAVNLGMTERSVERATEYLMKFVNADEVKIIGAIAACLYAAGIIENEKRTLREVSYAFDLSEATVRNYFKKYFKRTEKIGGILDGICCVVLSCSCGGRIG